MALVNLLPWREELRQEKKKEFLGILMLVLLLAGAAAFVWHAVIDGQIDDQKQRNKLLKDGIAQLDNDLKEIQKLEETRKQWLARMDVIQGLQSNRAEIVKVFDQFARAVPDGAFLSEIELTNESVISLVGFAESNARVSAFLQQLDATEKFQNSGLNLEIEKDETLGESGNTFKFKVSVVKPEALVEGDDGKGGEG